MINAESLGFLQILKPAPGGVFNMVNYRRLCIAPAFLHSYAIVRLNLFANVRLIFLARRDRFMRCNGLLQCVAGLTFLLWLNILQAGHWLSHLPRFAMAATFAAQILSSAHPVAAIRKHSARSASRAWLAFAMRSDLDGIAIAVKCAALLACVAPEIQAQIPRLIGVPADLAHDAPAFALNHFYCSLLFRQLWL
jgi:hypothetical protein